MGTAFREQMEQLMNRKSLLAVLVSGLMVTGVQAAGSQANGYLFGNIGQAEADGSAWPRSWMAYSQLRLISGDWASDLPSMTRIPLLKLALVSS